MLVYPTSSWDRIHLVYYRMMATVLGLP
jgi:hypothetical protein